VIILLVACLAVQAVVGARFAIDDAMAPAHVSRLSHTPRSICALHARNETARVARQLAAVASVDRPSTPGPATVALAGRFPVPRPIRSYPPYWSSVHLTI
jgi:hypothetical protein